MASGDTLVTLFPYDNQPPSSKFATLDTRNGHPVLDFDAADPEAAIFTAYMPRNYASGGITVTIGVMATSDTTTTNKGRYGFEFERIADGSTDLDADSYAATQYLEIAVSATSGSVVYGATAFTNGAAIDSIAAGEWFRLKVTRDASNGNDTMTGDAELVGIEIKET